MRFGLLYFAMLLTTPVAAQQSTPPDPIFLQGIIQAFEIQRNTALNMQAAAEAREGILRTQATKLQEDITRLTKEKSEIESKLKETSDAK